MNALGEQLFARARLPVNQHVGLVLGHVLGVGNGLHEVDVVAQNAAEGVLGAVARLLLLEMGVQLQALLHGLFHHGQVLDQGVHGHGAVFVIHRKHPLNDV